MSDAPKPVYDDPNASGTLLVTLVGVIALLAVMVFAVVLFQNTQQAEDVRKLYAPQPPELTQLRAEQLAQLTSYRMVDAKNDVVAIPIDLAMERCVAHLESGDALSIIRRSSPETPTTQPQPESP